VRRLRLLVLVALGALVLSSCTLVSSNAKPVRISNSKVGLNLLSPTIPGTNGAHVRFNTQPVYIVDATGQLAPSSRIVPTPAALFTDRATAARSFGDREIRWRLLGLA
jgi:hypothetical protein